MSNWIKRTPIKGDHIRIKFHDIYHHAIYVSTLCVVQFGLPMDIYDNPDKVKVITTSFEEFSKFGDEIEIRTYSETELINKRDNEQIVEYALSKVGEGGYNLMHNNCEHFANLCVFGKKISKQVDDIYSQVEMMLKGLKKDDK